MEPLEMAGMTKLDIAEGRHLPQHHGRYDVTKFYLGLNEARINFDLIEGNVFCGSVPITEADMDLIKKRGFGAILDLCGDNSNEGEMAKARGIAYLHEFVFDTYSPKQDQFKRIADYIEAEQKKHKVYVHCHAGRGRAPTSIIAWLISRGKDVMPALNLVHIKRKSETLFVSERQLFGLKTFAQSIRRKN